MKKIILHEVGPRDGLQAEEQIVATEQKIKWIEKLIDSGIDIIQLGSFVNPKKMPQMADTEELFRHFNQTEKMKHTILSGLVLNEKGAERAMNCGTKMICLGVSASETHSMKNTGMSTDEALKRITNIAKEILSAGIKVQASVQSAFGCGYEGIVPAEKVLRIVNNYIEAGITTISLADTSGHANPVLVEKLFTEIFKESPDINYACHFHNTYAMGLANCYAAFKTGVSYFESSFAGLGGCPFTALASGNVCTEDLAHMFHRMGIKQEINIEKISEVSKSAEEYFKRELPGMIYKTGVINYES
jgi:hydroxymethylglutaryl-CoA lyase